MTLEEWMVETNSFLTDTWGLNTDLARRVAVLILWGYVSGMSMSVTSGWRDPEKQRAMQARWDAGDRAGLAARPASSSKHTVTDLFGNPDSMAVDLSAGSDQNLRILGNWATKYLGLQWGGHFSLPDLVHFYI